MTVANYCVLFENNVIFLNIAYLPDDYTAQVLDVLQNKQKYLQNWRLFFWVSIIKNLIK